MTTMPGTLQRPWPPGTYEAAHRQAAPPLNEARARAGLPAALVGVDYGKDDGATIIARPAQPGTTYIAPTRSCLWCGGAPGSPTCGSRAHYGRQ